VATKKFNKKIEKRREKNWREIPIGGMITEPGNSKNYKTGSWRTFRPITDFSKCIHCMQCWIVCPDDAIIVKNKKKIKTDLNFCKGCGLCAEVCPVKCIEMRLESEFEKKVKGKNEKRYKTYETIDRN